MQINEHNNLKCFILFLVILLIHVFLSANIFQLTNKSCPWIEPLPIFRRQNCDTDRDCWPRICCGYDGPNGQKYCRIPLPSSRNNLLKAIMKSKGIYLYYLTNIKTIPILHLLLEIFNCTIIIN